MNACYVFAYKDITPRVNGGLSSYFKFKKKKPFIKIKGGGLGEKQRDATFKRAAACVCVCRRERDRVNFSWPVLVDCEHTYKNL